MFPVLFGHGLVATKESALLIQASLFMLVVIIPVIGLLFFFAWRYRKGSGARYTPHWEHSIIDELIWWAVPIEIVLVLAAVTWSSTHELDPRKALASNTPALTVEVVALPWKWLFIYPSLGIATVNYVAIPEDAPVAFEITADAPMNSFWVPSLGGQIYAMSGMVNTLNLMADEPGTYSGLSANYSGEGFADMRFDVDAMTADDFDAWTARAGPSAHFGWQQYLSLRSPGTTTVELFGSSDSDLFNRILAQFPHAAGGHAH